MKSEETTHLLPVVGAAQMDAVFQRQSEVPAIDDSEFMPLVEVVLNAFEADGIDQEAVEELWEYAFAHTKRAKIFPWAAIVPSDFTGRASKGAEPGSEVA